MEIKSDLEMVIHKFPEDMNVVNVYPVGDTQYGSAGFDEELYEKWCRIVERDPCGYVLMVGDMINNGLKNSKTNIYREIKTPIEQKTWLDKQVERFGECILGGVAGNHELRTVDAVGTCPMYDVFDKWGLDDTYRENMMFAKISLGKRGDKQYTYMLAVHHGGSENKIRNFGYALENCDMLISGHIHKPKSDFPARIVVDPRNDKVRYVPFRNIVVPSFDKAGYALRGAYMPQSSNIIPIITLHGDRKGADVQWIEI